LYGNAYVSWAIQGMEFRNAAPAGSRLLLPFHIFPGRIAKEIICMFASACGPGLCEKSPELTRYVLNRDHRGIPNQFRIYCYLMGPDSMMSRQAGITGLISDRSSHVFSEISFPPFGYILTIDSPPVDEGLLDITHFTGFGYNDWRSEYFRMPVRKVNSYFPGDYQSADEWMASLDRVHGPLPAA
jgi:hypothetical protein